MYVRIMNLQKKTETYEEAGHGGHQNELNGIGLLPSREASLGRKSAEKAFKYNQAVKRSGMCERMEIRGLCGVVVVWRSNGKWRLNKIC